MDIMPQAKMNRSNDYLTESGAKALVGRIRAFWRAKGLFPNVWAEALPVADNAAMPEREVWQVRSDIRVAGLWTGKFAA